MPQLQIGTIDKRINSTSQTFTLSYAYDCKLKEPCSMEAPVFKIDGLQKGTFYNYAKFENRYFWVDDIVYLTNDIQEVHCRLDPLATYLSDIRAGYAWVQYGDEVHWNKWIDDTRFNPEKEDSTKEHHQLFNLLPDFNEQGSIIMVYNDCSGVGGANVINLTLTSYFNMIIDLSDISSENILGKVTATLGGFGNIYDNVQSILWVPWICSGSWRTGSIYIGGVEIKNVYHAPLYPVMQETYMTTIDLDWSYANSHPYLKHDRWTDYQLVTPFGFIDLPIAPIVNQSHIYIIVSIIKTTGEITYNVYDDGDYSGTTGTGQLLGSMSGHVGVDIKNLAYNGPGILQGLGNAYGVGAKMAGAAMSAGIGGANLMIHNAEVAATGAEELTKIQGQMGGLITSNPERAFNKSMTSSAIGTGITAAGAVALSTGVGPAGPSGSIGGGLASLWATGKMGKCLLVRRVYEINDSVNYETYCTRYGYPVNAYLNLGTINGYCKTSAASISIAGASPSAISSVNSLLNEGIYIED